MKQSFSDCNCCNYITYLHLPRSHHLALLFSWEIHQTNIWKARGFEFRRSLNFFLQLIALIAAICEDRFCICISSAGQYIIYFTVTICCWVSWSFSLPLIHRLYTTLEYREAINAVERAVKRNHNQVMAFTIHSLGKCSAHSFAVSLRRTARNDGMLRKVEKIQELAMITCLQICTP